MDNQCKDKRTDRLTLTAAPGDHRARPRTYEQPALDDTPLNPKRCRYVLQLILQRHNWQHSSKHKGVSHKTMAERTRFCVWLFDFLRGHPKHFKLDPRTFSGRHVEAVTGYWQVEARAGRMSPATIQTYFSFMKTFAGWVGKPKLLKPIACYFDDPMLYQRHLANGVDKSWRAKGVDAAAVISEVEAYDVHAAASLRLMQAFQLRFKESVMFRPHSDVISGAQAGNPADGVACYLDTHRGTKGGRKRLFPIDNEMRQDAAAGDAPAALRDGVLRHHARRPGRCAARLAAPGRGRRLREHHGCATAHRRWFGRAARARHAGPKRDRGSPWSRARTNYKRLLRKAPHAHRVASSRSRPD